MNAARVNNLLHSMAKSCDVYSQEALEERKKLREVMADSRSLGRAVHRIFNLALRTNHEVSLLHRQAFRSRAVSTAPETPVSEPSAESILRPTPFPANNYGIPAQPLVGPMRFHQSSAAQRRREEELERAEECSRWPKAFQQQSELHDGLANIDTGGSRH